MSSVRSFVEQQLNEIDFLRSSYESTGEFHLDDFDAFDEAKKFVDGQIDEFHRNLCFTLKIPLNETNIEFQLVYPLLYPLQSIDVQIRTYLPREAFSKLTDALKEFLREKIDAENPYVFELIEWLRDHEDLFVRSILTSTTTTSQSMEKSSTYSRLWIYSHHIFNTEKRRNILHWAQQMKLNGFSLPGKPGIVCVEGVDDDVDEFWTRLRKLNWKKLQIKHRENLDGKDSFRFENFSELNFVDEATAKGDFGVFLQFLKEKHCENVFQLFFGIDKREKN